MKLTREQKDDIARAYFNGHQNPQDIARRYGVYTKTVLNILAAGNPEEYVPPFPQTEDYVYPVTLYGCPMCGKQYGIRAKSQYIYKEHYKNHTYYFCGYKCHEQFKRNAEELRGNIYGNERRKDL